MYFSVHSTYISFWCEQLKGTHSILRKKLPRAIEAKEIFPVLTGLSRERNDPAPLSGA